MARWWGVVLIGGVVVVALGAGVACDSGTGTDGEEEARYRAVTDADLACLAAYGRLRGCVGEAVAGTADQACPAGVAGDWYDTYGRECVAAHTAEWDCEAALECSETGCETEAEHVAATCTLVADGG